MKKEIKSNANFQTIVSNRRNGAGRLVTWIVSVACAASVYAQQDQQQVAFHAAAVNDGDYSKREVKNQSQADFGNSNLSAQQMIDFFRSEHKKLSMEINELIAKSTSGDHSSLAADESDIVQVAILRNKLEYLEVTMKKWIAEGEF